MTFPNERANPHLTVENLTKTFGEKVAVQDVSFAVYPGEVFGLLGPNGAGKTTTIRLILDIFPADAGTIAVLGGRMNEARMNRIGYMPEERGLYANMRVLDCLTYMGALKGLSRREARRCARTYLERMELADQERARISTLSRGMTQKVQVIAAVLHEPDLLIIDEPFANLDPLNAQLVRAIILELRQKGHAVIMTSHQMALVESLCDRIALMHDGRFVLQGTLADVRRQFARNTLYVSGSGRLEQALPGVRHVEQRTASDWYLTLEPGAPPQAVAQALLRNGQFVLDRFEVAMPRLDEIFVQVVRNAAPGETAP
jgi:ABC-2 type transport system ATP-binding protein